MAESRCPASSGDDAVGGPGQPFGAARECCPPQARLRDLVAKWQTGPEQERGPKGGFRGWLRCSIDAGIVSQQCMRRQEPESLLDWYDNLLESYAAEGVGCDALLDTAFRHGLVLETSWGNVAFLSQNLCMQTHLSAHALLNSRTGGECNRFAPCCSADARGPRLPGLSLHQPPRPTELWATCLHQRTGMLVGAKYIDVPDSLKQVAADFAGQVGLSGSSRRRDRSW